MASPVENAANAQPQPTNTGRSVPNPGTIKHGGYENDAGNTIGNPRPDTGQVGTIIDTVA